MTEGPLWPIEWAQKKEEEKDEEKETKKKFACTRCLQSRQRVTCNDGFVRTSGDGDVAVLDDDEVVAGRRRRVRELVALVDLRADDRHLGRSVDHDAQHTAAGARRHHHEPARLTCASRQETAQTPLSPRVWARGNPPYPVTSPLPPPSSLSFSIFSFFLFLTHASAARVEVNMSLAFLYWVGIALHP